VFANQSPQHDRLIGSCRERAFERRHVADKSRGHSLVNFDRARVVEMRVNLESLPRLCPIAPSRTM
jgi:hypothetical protein